MGWLLDTCVLSEFTKPKPSSAVERWLASEPDAGHFVSALSVGEIGKGIARLAPGPRRNALERWFGDLRARLGDRILAVDEVVALEWGRLFAAADARGRPILVVDGLIGATAIVHGHTIVTRNTADFARTGAPTFDPWKP